MVLDILFAFKNGHQHIMKKESNVLIILVSLIYFKGNIAPQKM